LIRQRGDQRGRHAPGGGDRRHVGRQRFDRPPPAHAARGVGRDLAPAGQQTLDRRRRSVRQRDVDDVLGMVGGRIGAMRDGAEVVRA